MMYLSLSTKISGLATVLRGHPCGFTMKTASTEKYGLKVSPLRERLGRWRHQPSKLISHPIALTKLYDRIGLCSAVAMWSPGPVSSHTQTESWQAFKTHNLSPSSYQSIEDLSRPTSPTASLHSHKAELTAWCLETRALLTCINSGVTLLCLTTGKFHFQICLFFKSKILLRFYFSNQILVLTGLFIRAVF